MILDSQNNQGRKGCINDLEWLGDKCKDFLTERVDKFITNGSIRGILIDYIIPTRFMNINITAKRTRCTWQPPDHPSSKLAGLALKSYHVILGDAQTNIVNCDLTLM